jgi:hypothetical protein
MGIRLISLHACKFPRGREADNSDTEEQGEGEKGGSHLPFTPELGEMEESSGEEMERRILLAHWLWDKKSCVRKRS